MRPGEVYRVAATDEIIEIPRLPFEISSTAADFASNGISTQKIHVLSQEYLSEMIELLSRTWAFFEAIGVQSTSCISDGTLLGLMRQKSILLWDDDIDTWVDWRNRAHFWTEDAQTLALKHGLRFSCIANSKLKSADYSLLKLHLDLAGNAWVLPLLDLLFYVRVPKKWSKEKSIPRILIENFQLPELSDDVIRLVSHETPDTLFFEKNNVYELKKVFPLKSAALHHVTVNIPQDPKHIIERTYGPDVLKTQRARHPLIIGATVASCPGVVAGISSSLQLITQRQVPANPVETDVTNFIVSETKEILVSLNCSIANYMWGIDSASWDLVKRDIVKKITDYQGNASVCYGVAVGMGYQMYGRR